jgi:hypothetical protein
MVLMQVDESLAFRRLQSFELVLRVRSLAGVRTGAVIMKIGRRADFGDFRILDGFGNVLTSTIRRNIPLQMLLIQIDLGINRLVVLRRILVFRRFYYTIDACC